MNNNFKRNEIMDDLNEIRDTLYPAAYRRKMKASGECNVLKQRENQLITRLCNLHKQIKEELK